MIRNARQKSFGIIAIRTPGVKEFYRQNHTHQTRDFVLEKKRQYGALNKTKMGIWEALEYSKYAGG